MLVASDTVERSPAAVVGQDTAERVNTLLAGRWAGSPRRFLISTYALAKAPQLLYLAGLPSIEEAPVRRPLRVPVLR